MADIATIDEKWDGHDGTEVEKFIKQTLNQKAGVFYEDTARQRYLVFASTESRDRYLADPNKTELILGIVKAGGGGGTEGYEITVSLTSDYYMAALPTQKGLYIEFNFNVTNKQGLPTGDDVLAVFTFRWNNVTKTATQKFTAGQRARLAIDDYIGDSGVTNITIQLTGVETSATTSFAVVCNKVDLTLTDNFKTNNSYNLISNPSTAAAIPYTLSGAGLKTMEWYVDGTAQTFVKADDEVTEQSTSRTKYIPVGGLSEGVHSLQFRAYTMVNGEKFYSQTVYREFAVYRAQNTDKVHIMVGADLNVGQLVTASAPLTLKNITQYLPYTIKIGVFNTTAAANTPVEVYLDNEKQATLSMSNAAEQQYTFTVTATNVGAIKLKHNAEIKTVPVEIVPSSSSLTEITAGMSLNLRALGRNNASADKDTWTYNSVTTSFSDFKWNAQSGWNDNRLVMSDGAAITVNQAPLSGEVTNTGKTLEFEFATSSVINDDAVICDLRNGTTGILITASEASLSSAAGTKVSVKYKSEENIRIAFVVNPSEGVTNKRLVFIYVNGILSGAANYAISDNFRVTKNLAFVSSAQATIKLKELRFYDSALSSDQVLNNYMLYRDTVSEMLEVYDRNNIYVEGTADFSTDALSGQLPIMIVTGNIPALEATTDKNLQIEVDVEYTNLQDPTRSFKMTKAAMRPQGTSSMGYPKKNFRLYTNKFSDTVLYDSYGNTVQNKLYAFKAGAQPVDCWCFKADYAESSSTHNTGIARLWNDVLKDAQVPEKTGVDEAGAPVFGNNQYRLRTEAQKAAIQNGYLYDVRTTIDGFPMLMFYRLTQNSPLVFIGKYNFNNDKSTESVFGFRDIPGFDNTRMQCWEVLNNGHHLALFQDTTRWAYEWSDAFEARYPDGATDTTDLKAFATWMSSVTQANFATQKWQHLDVYKIAAYYIYLMRFGAVDQVVKNAMFTSEDGVHWYYINYDNDTIIGLRNDGLLVYPPTIDRQTLDTSFTATVYAYAGHDSRLWNMLEADTEFMDIVKVVDASLYTAGLTYANVIKVFDTDQSDKWCERVYNQDSQYKYVGPFANNNINNLFMLQGSRKSHRRWWLSRRFNLMDGKFVSGAYKDNVFEVKLAGAPIGLHFSIVSGFPMNYGYGVNNVPIQSGIFLNANASHQFSTTSVLNVGDPLRLYAAPNIKEIDIHEFTPYLSTVNMAGVYSPTLSTTLEKLVLGSEGTTVNNALYELSGLSNAVMLKHLDIRGYKAINALNLAENIRLTTLLASNSGLASLTLADGAPVTRLDLPSTMQIIDLHNLPQLAASGLTVAGSYANVTTLKITGCGNLNTKSILDTWLANKTTAHDQCVVQLDGINWTGIDPTWLVQFGNMYSVSFKGVAAVTSINESAAERLTAAFGLNCFSASAEFYIKLPAGHAIIAGPSTVQEEKSYQYTAIMADIVDPVTFSITPAGYQNISINQNGVLTVGFDPSPLSFVVRASSRNASNMLVQASKAVMIKPYTYPSDADTSIDGLAIVISTGIHAYELKISGGPYTGRYNIEWSIVSNGGATVSLEPNGTKCNMLLTKLIPASYIKLKAAVKRTSGTVVVEKVIEILMSDSLVIMTTESNPNMMAYMYAKGYAARPAFMTQAEAEAVTTLTIDNNLSNPSQTLFDEFQYFTNVTSFSIEPYLKSISLPFMTYRLSYSSISIAATTINLPITAEIRIDSSLSWCFRCANFNAPALKKIVCSGTPLATGLLMFSSTINMELNVPSLEEIDFSSVAQSSSNTIFMLYNSLLQSSTNIRKIEFPNLKKMKRSNNSIFSYLISIQTYTSGSAYLSLDCPALQEKDLYFSFMKGNNSSCFLDLSVGGAIGLSSGLYFADYSGNYSALLRDFSAPAATGTFVLTYPTKIKTLIIPKGYFNNNTSSSNAIDIETLSCYSFDGADALNRCKLERLMEIYIYSPTAPVINGAVYGMGAIGASMWGDSRPRMLYLKQGATGYDATVWNTAPLSSYTKSFTL